MIEPFDRVEVLGDAGLVAGEPAVLDAALVVSRTAGRVTAHQVGEVEFDFKLIAVQHQVRFDRSLPALGPRRHGVHDELQALLLDVGERRTVEVRDHVRRHPKQASDVRDLELAQLQELGVLVRDTHLMELHAVFQHQHLAPVGTGLGSLVGLPEYPLGLGILEVARELDPAPCGFGIVVEEPGAIVLRG